MTKSKIDPREEGIIGEMTDKKRRYKMQILKENIVIESTVCPCNWTAYELKTWRTERLPTGEQVNYCRVLTVIVTSS